MKWTSETEITRTPCSQCGACITACREQASGVFSENTVLTIVQDCLTFYRSHSNGGDRFAEFFTNGDFTDIRISGDWTCIYRN
jgi:hypothetical protein